MSRYTKGIVISTTAIVAGLLSFYTAWDVWLSQAIISSGNQQAATIQWQDDYGQKIDTLLQHSGVDPLIFKNVQTTPQN